MLDRNVYFKVRATLTRECYIDVVEQFGTSFLRYSDNRIIDACQRALQAFWKYNNNWMGKLLLARSRRYYNIICRKQNSLNNVILNMCTRRKKQKSIHLFFGGLKAETTSLYPPELILASNIASSTVSSSTISGRW